MKRYTACLVSALLAGVLSLYSTAQAKAASHAVFSQLASPIGAGSDALQLAGYYDNYDRRDDYDGDYGEDDDYDDGGHCGYTHYKRKYVCDETVPRCFRQRKCIWWYGREYCRYGQKCVGGNDRSCKWIEVPVRSCR